MVCIQLQTFVIGITNHVDAVVPNHDTFAGRDSNTQIQGHPEFPASSTSTLQHEDVTNPDCYLDTYQDDMDESMMDPWWLHEDFQWLGDFDIARSEAVPDAINGLWSIPEVLSSA